MGIAIKNGHLEIVKRCQLVVWRPGTTDGVWWEFENIARTCAPDKVVIYLPQGRRARRAHVDELRRRAREILKLEISEKMFKKRFICFTSG